MGFEEYHTPKQEAIRLREEMRRLRTGEKRVYKKNDTSRNDNIQRAKKKALEIAYANDFQYFVTFTLDEQKVDRYGREEVLRVFKNWLDNTARRRDMQYLIFPEFHKDGAVHFHGIVAGRLDMRDSGHKTAYGQTIYNCENWKLGFTTAVKLDSQKSKVVSYIMKYITKENKRVFGKHYFAGGKGLRREVPTTYKNMDIHALEGTYYKIPNAPLGVKYVTIPKEVDL